MKTSLPIFTEWCKKSC